MRRRIGELKRQGALTEAQEHNCERVVRLCAKALVVVGTDERSRSLDGELDGQEENANKDESTFWSTKEHH